MILGCVLVAVVYGSVATPSRHWDGVVAWDPKAAVLALDLTLDQSYFTQPAVFCHSRDYPLLQPLLIASIDRLLGDGLGRLIFPFAFVVMIAAVGCGLRRHGVLPARAWLVATALAVTPMLVNPSSGSIDSGYADGFLAMALAGLGSGMLMRLPGLAAAAIIVAVSVKPEGIVYSSFAVLVCLALGERRMFRTALCALAAAAMLWLPLQHRLIHTGEPAPLAAIWIGIAAAAGAGWGLDAFFARRALGTLGRSLGSIAAVVGLIVVLFVLGESGGSLSLYLSNGSRVL